LEVALQVSLGRGAAVHACIGPNESQVLALGRGKAGLGDHWVFVRVLIQLRIRLHAEPQRGVR